jgi:SAM-dependent methyltransferase
MDARLQRRVQRYGWDLAADRYESLWRSQLAPAQTELMASAQLRPGQRVLDVACGTGLVSLQAARCVAPDGDVLGVDLSGQMIDAAQARSCHQCLDNLRFERMDAEQLKLPDHSFDVVLCALGLMYVPDPEQALREMRRVLRPGGRMIAAVWGHRDRCGWSPLFAIVDAEVSSEVCPLFFRLGLNEELARACSGAGLRVTRQCRVASSIDYDDADQACAAAFVGGPVALAWSRFDAAARTRVRARYLEAIGGWRRGLGYRLPGEFMIVTATAG